MESCNNGEINDIVDTDTNVGCDDLSLDDHLLVGAYASYTLT
jgi:hypothetical protein